MELGIIVILIIVLFTLSLILADLVAYRNKTKNNYKDIIAVEEETLHVDFFFHGRKTPMRQSFTDTYYVNEDNGKVEVTTAKDKLEKFLSNEMLYFSDGDWLTLYTPVNCKAFPKSSLKEYKTTYNHREDRINIFALKDNKWEQLPHDCWKDSHDFKK